MPRKMIVQTAGGGKQILEETLAESEAHLQELVKDNPDLLPIEEFDMPAPLMVVGRETALPSGAVDLVALTRAGDLLIIEFKTGPQNADFRHALAQLLDYGSDLWGMSYDAFEQAVPVRYFNGNRCRDPRLQGKRSLEDAARAIWPDLSDEERERIGERLGLQLKDGSFHYLLVAQRFTLTIERSIEYMNASMRQARFYAVELVQFAGAGLAAYESRAILKPSIRPPPPPTSEVEFLEQIQDHTYRQSVRELLDACRGLTLRFEWGSVGTSVRVQTPDRPEPVTIAWLFPPGRTGWYGLTDVTLGFDSNTAEKLSTARPVLEEYLAAVAELPGVEPVKAKGVRGYRLPPGMVPNVQARITDILGNLVSRVNAGATEEAATSAPYRPS